MAVNFEAANTFFRSYYGLDEAVGYAKPNSRGGGVLRRGPIVHQKLQYDYTLTDDELADDHEPVDSQPTSATGDEPNDEAVIYSLLQRHRDRRRSARNGHNVFQNGGIRS